MKRSSESKIKSLLSKRRKTPSLFKLTIWWRFIRKRFAYKNKSLDPLKLQLEELNNAIHGQKRILLDKNKVITENEKKIYELKKTTHELEKFKFVLDHTIKDLHREINPKEEQIKELKVIIAKEDERLKNYNNANSNYDLLVQQLKEESTRLAEKILEEKDKITRLNYKIQFLKKFIFDCIQLIQNHDTLKDKLNEIQLDKFKEVVTDDGIDVENKNQIAYLKHALENFQQNIHKGVDFHKIDNRNSIKENIQLIREILKLRKEIKNFKSTEKADTILMRKDKKIKGILDENERKIEPSKRDVFLYQQELEIQKLLLELEDLKHDHE